MIKGNVVAGLSEEQYAEIELAVMESERGRTFLREYLARNRSADTRMLLDAISRLESALCLKAIEHEGGERFTPALAEIAAVVTATRTEIAAIRNDLIAGGGALPQGPQAFATAADQANGLSADFLKQVEQLETLVSKIRDLGVEAEICDTLEACIEELMTLCWKQDVNGQRAAKALSVLQFVNDRTGGHLASADAAGLTEAAPQDALCAPVEQDADEEAQDAFFAADAELFTETQVIPAPKPAVSAAAPGFAYVATAEDELSTNEIVAEDAAEETEPQPAAPASSEASAEAPNTDSAVEPSAMTASDLVETPLEMIGPANLKGFNQMAASLNDTGPVSSTTLVKMVTPTEVLPAVQTTPVAEPSNPFQTELDKMAEKDGFAFTPADRAPEEASPETKSDVNADSDADVDTDTEDDEGNGHIVIIRTPSEPEAPRLPEAIMQEQLGEDGEVPMVEISPPSASKV